MGTKWTQGITRLRSKARQWSWETQRATFWRLPFSPGWRSRATMNPVAPANSIPSKGLSRALCPGRGHMWDWLWWLHKVRETKAKRWRIGPNEVRSLVGIPDKTLPQRVGSHSVNENKAMGHTNEDRKETQLHHFSLEWPYNVPSTDRCFSGERTLQLYSTSLEHTAVLGGRERKFSDGL